MNNVSQGKIYFIKDIYYSISIFFKYKAYSETAGVQMKQLNIL